jgi:2-C-methyl-D-erythritol 4-phosphate cytidylyltransferase / 2-C-methyl-D-erythritol 2,4-cyclodiphosphate synthase
MGGTDKLMAPIAGRPLLAWTLGALAASPAVDRLVLVAAAERVDAIASAPWLPARVDAVVAGGATRQASVAAGVRYIDALDPAGGERPVLIHDGARPLVSAALVEAVAAAVARHGAAIPVVPVAETLKRVGDGMVHETVDRSALAVAQTPQGARRRLLLEAWARFPPDGPPEFTDEAALLEACTIPVHAIPGEAVNLKVTLPDDLRRVERALAPVVARTGFGHDSHPFGPGSPLRLGGVEIAGAPRLHGHSDGDVALHAVADALLGAAGLGDLGRLFPADARTPRGVASDALLGEVVTRLASVGLRPASVDVTIIGARPRLGARLDAMRAAVASLLGIEEDAVNVKASTGNLAGDEGAGRSIAARAVATVRGWG